MIFIKQWAFIFFHYEKINCSPSVQHFLSENRAARRKNINVAIGTARHPWLTVRLWTSFFSYVSVSPLIKARGALRFFSVLLLRKTKGLQTRWEMRSSIFSLATGKEMPTLHGKVESPIWRFSGPLYMCVHFTPTAGPTPHQHASRHTHRSLPWPAPPYTSAMVILRALTGDSSISTSWAAFKLCPAKIAQGQKTAQLEF